MPKLTYERATKTKAKLRMAFTGPAKSGKTYTALVLATALANGGRIGVIDTERGSSRKYADLFNFDIVELEEFHPNTYIAAIEMFEAAGHAVIVIDSLSHAWAGKRGVLELHDDATKASRSDNSWAAWRGVTPLHQGLVDKILRANAHIIATMRSKMAYIQTKDDSGKTEIKKVGLAPVQRQGMEYEFDILAEMRHDHQCVIGDTRCPAVDGATQLKPDGDWFQPIIDWLSDGAKPAPPKTEPHWMEDDKARARFWARCDKLGLGKPAVHREFAVESMKNCPFSLATVDALLDMMENAMLTATLSLADLHEALGIEKMADVVAKQIGRNAADQKIAAWIAAETDEQDALSETAKSHEAEEGMEMAAVYDSDEWSATGKLPF